MRENTKQIEKINIVIYRASPVYDEKESKGEEPTQLRVSFPGLDTGTTEYAESDGFMGEEKWLRETLLGWIAELDFKKIVRKFEE